ncbi:MAG: hypothetical protein LC623_09775 [Halobacteriales archaeon]|nr:hypothetical protein [Halobacteriales archaeon]
MRRRIESLENPSGPVPDWLRLRIHDGELELQLPDSYRFRAEAEQLALAGTIDAELRYNPTKKDWVVSWIRAPQATVITPRILELRNELAKSTTAKWVKQATERDLATALAITRLPNWQSIEWPERIWNARLRRHSKSGNASALARKLGLTVPERSVPVWFFGEGSLEFRDRKSIRVEGELCLPDTWLSGLKSIVAPSVGFIENADVAFATKADLVVATWGALKPTHAKILEVAVAQKIPTWGWFDMDAEGVRMARLAKRLGVEAIVGFQDWPRELGQPLTAEKRLILQDELKVAEQPYRKALTWIDENDAWWEQEALVDSVRPPPRS